MIAHDALDLLGREHVFPLAGPPLAKEAFGIFRLFAKSLLVLLIFELVEGGAFGAETVTRGRQ